MAQIEYKLNVRPQPSRRRPEQACGTGAGWLLLFLEDGEATPIGLAAP